MGQCFGSIGSCRRPSRALPMATFRCRKDSDECYLGEQCVAPNCRPALQFSRAGLLDAGFAASTRFQRHSVNWSLPFARGQCGNAQNAVKKSRTSSARAGNAPRLSSKPAPQPRHALARRGITGRSSSPRLSPHSWRSASSHIATGSRVANTRHCSFVRTA